jgi:hypothetical protein
MTFDKETYRSRRKAGQRGQDPYPSAIVGYTPADKVKEGAPGTRSERRAVEAHGAVRRRLAKGAA